MRVNQPCAPDVFPPIVLVVIEADSVDRYAVFVREIFDNPFGRRI